VASRITAAGFATLAAAYPFLCAYLIGKGWSGAVLLLFAALTLWRGFKAGSASARLACALGAALLLAGAYRDPAYAARAIPAFVYLSLAALFGHTLWRPPSLCERMVRLQYPDFKPGIAEYLRQVTGVWAAFFAANAVLCALLPLFAEDWLWTFYTGAGVYGLMAALVLGEYLYRPRRFPDLAMPPPLDTLKVLLRHGHRLFKDAAP
jgi:uncharacterized membrane protein